MHVWLSIYSRKTAQGRAGLAPLEATDVNHIVNVFT